MIEGFEESRENSKEPRPQSGALNQNSKAKAEIPKQVRDDKKRDPNHLVMLNLGLMEIRLVSASGVLFSAFGRRIFHPRPQDGVFRCAFNKNG